MAIDLLAFSGHKGLLGPQGTGGLFAAETITVKPHCFGGTGSASESDLQPAFMPDMLESGTPNMPGIAGLLAGLRYVRARGVEKIRNSELALTKRLMEGLASIPTLRLLGPAMDEPRTAVVSFVLGDMDSAFAASELDARFGIACRGGLHCAPWAHRQMGTFGSGAVRLSPGIFNTETDIDLAIEAIRDICRQEGA